MEQKLPHRDRVHCIMDDLGFEAIFEHPDAGGHTRFVHSKSKFSFDVWMTKSNDLTVKIAGEYHREITPEELEAIIKPYI